ncbi:Uncharacterised protein, partial [Mycoplasma putrefaciens]
MGGAGLFTTAADYIKFLDALLDGKYQQTEIISSQLLEQMRSDQLSKHNLKQFFKW